MLKFQIGVGGLKLNCTFSYGASNLNTFALEVVYSGISVEGFSLGGTDEYILSSMVGVGGIFWRSCGNWFPVNSSFLCMVESLSPLVLIDEKV